MWQDRAACAGADLALFFPDRRRDYRETIRLFCSVCDVSAECLAEAMRVEQAGQHSRHGIWGGLTPNQRTEIEKKKRVR